MTQEQVAHAAGISRNHLQVIESGLSDRASRKPFNPHLSVLLNLCNAVGIPLADVVVEVFPPASGAVLEYTEPNEHRSDEKA